MWEAIRSNHRRSTVLIWVMGFVLILLGYVIGYSFGDVNGGYVGMGAAFIIWIIMLIAAFAQGKEILISATGAMKISKLDHPVLYNVVEEMAIASGLGKPPEIYIIEEDGLNAFAMGIKPQNSAVAVTSGLLKQLNRDELQGVIGHEVGHIVNQDIRFMTIAAVTMGAIIMLSDLFLRTLRYSGGRRSSRRGGGEGQLIILLVALALAILAPIVAQLLYFSCSRKREYLADASSARFTRYPEGLASALEKIGAGPKMQKGVNRAVAPMYTVNPLQRASVSSLFSTHPPLDKRINILRKLGGNASYAAYESSYRTVVGPTSHLMGASSLVGAQAVAVREASADAGESEGFAERSSLVSKLLDSKAGYVQIPCECGLNIKVPPGYKGSEIHCPRCGRKHNIKAEATIPSS